MELPTFTLGLTTLVPRWRSNVLFAVTFGATRIAFRLVLLYALAMVRELPTPATILALVFPLHAMWFRGCIAGFVRRHKARAATRNASGESVVVQTKPEIGIDGCAGGSTRGASARGAGTI
ncbi:hypothetical protein C8R45DRAFT_184992 [Mycena sanguinolenta]|nr:hypothetical protein C8R45DRAFT_184992 [Mycena sanguinolenta]